jgi:hypothetical protein
MNAADFDALDEVEKKHFYKLIVSMKQHFVQASTSLDMTIGHSSPSK